MQTDFSDFGLETLFVHLHVRQSKKPVSHFSGYLFSSDTGQRKSPKMAPKCLSRTAVKGSRYSAHPRPVLYKRDVHLQLSRPWRHEVSTQSGQPLHLHKIKQSEAVSGHMSGVEVVELSSCYN